MIVKRKNGSNKSHIMGKAVNVYEVCINKRRSSFSRTIKLAWHVTPMTATRMALDYSA